MFVRYHEWRQRRRAVHEARMLLREAKRGLRRYGHRVSEKHAAEVRKEIAPLEAAIATKSGDADALPRGINALDKKLDEHLPFARKSTAREYVESIAVAVLIALFLRAFVVEAFKIPSGSMIPTLQVGDHIFVNKFIYGVRLPWTNVKFGMSYHKPRRGEVIVFIYPKEPDKDFIKRIVAVEGDTVEVRDNVVLVNDQPIPRQHVDGECRYPDYDEESDHWIEKRCEQWSETVAGNRYSTFYNKHGEVHSWPPVRVPEGAVFVMGDNRDNSHDSRFWGTVPFELIKGKAMVIWWSSGEPGDPEANPLVRFLQGVRWTRMFQLVQ
jgi:signal peptidase I